MTNMTMMMWHPMIKKVALKDHQSRQALLATKLIYHHGT